MIQVWRETQDTFHLVDQFRERCSFGDLERAARILIGRHRASAVLIENAAQGPALLSRLIQTCRDVQFIPVEALESKSDRLQPHRAAIRAGRISLSPKLSNAFEYIDEMVNFPNGPNDQVDATTQYLVFMATKPILRRREPNNGVGLSLGSQPRAFSEAELPNVSVGIAYRRR